jgi:RNA polymerase sigma-70 factor (ECF subfamily)
MLTSSAVSPRVAECYGRYRGQLWAAFYAMCSDPERAWEAVQEAFLRLQEQTGQVIRDERAWLLQVGKNWLRDGSRRRSQGACVEANLDGVTSPALDPSGAAARDELRDHVGLALGRLRSEDREVLTLRYALGWSSPRIAEVLGIRVASVDMRLCRARQRLATELRSLGVDAECLG